ncbi:MAG: hypothetical protein KDB65_04020 [Calditrichaeota bacterium]|nr:hypothetical protein [Calditrichota bacterium]MCB9368829.1 hypothetical protein [Calditrichota bacterium]
MKIGTGYTPPILPQQRVNTIQHDAHGERNSAEAKLRELIAQKHAEFETFRPVEELGKNLDLRA